MLYVPRIDQSYENMNVGGSSGSYKRTDFGFTIRTLCSDWYSRGWILTNYRSIVRKIIGIVFQVERIISEVLVWHRPEKITGSESKTGENMTDYFSMIQRMSWNWFDIKEKIQKHLPYDEGSKGLTGRSNGVLIS